MASFPLTIATVDKNLFTGEVQFATCPGADGELTLLAHHTPFITTLKKGVITIQEEKDTDKQIFDIERGLLEVGHNRATILV